MKLLAETEGIWTETAGGVTLAVTQKLIEQGRIDRDESVVDLHHGQRSENAGATARPDAEAGRDQAGTRGLRGACGVVRAGPGGSFSVTENEG